MPRISLLLSGGVDSMVCLHMLWQASHEVAVIFVDYGQAAVLPEREAVRKIARRFGCGIFEIGITGLKGFGVGEILHRNAALIFLAAVAAQDRDQAIHVQNFHALGMMQEKMLSFANHKQYDVFTTHGQYFRTVMDTVFAEVGD